MAKKRIRQIIIAAVLVIIFLTAGFVVVNMLRDGDVSIPYIGTIGRDLEPETEDLTKPGEIAAGSGNGSYYLIDPDRSYGTASSKGKTAYETLLSWISEYLDGGAEAEKINETEFIRASSGNTVTAIYNCDIPFQDFIRHNGMDVPGGDTIQNVTRLVLADSGGGSMLLYDGNRKQYYRISRNEGSGGVTSSRLEKMVGSARKSGTTECGTHSGVLTGENELIIKEDPEIRHVSAEIFKPEYDPTSSRALRSLEDMFFPGGLDFVHKVEEADGSITYMYGSRQKVLRIDGSGGFTYTREETGGVEGSLTTPDFYESLSDSVKYIKDHGGWISENGIQIKLNKAEKISADGDDAAGYRFTFCLEADDLQLMYSDGSALYVETRGNTVTSYHRDLPDVKSVPELTVGSGRTADSDNDEKNTDAEGPARETDGEELRSLSEVLYENREVISAAAGTDASGSIEKSGDETDVSKNTDETDEEVTAAERDQYAETVMNDLSAARLCLYRTDSGTLQDDAQKETDTKKTLDDQDSDDTQEIQTTGGRVVTPAWYARAGDHAFWFSAITGKLISDKS